MTFIHLRVHSAFSLLESTIKIKDIPDLCHKHMMPAIAITDTHNMFGALEFSKTLSSKGIQPLIGCQINIRLDDLDLNKGQISSNTPSSMITHMISQMVVLVRSEEGYLNLLRLISDSYLLDQISDGKPFINLKDLCNRSDGLIALSGGTTGPIGELLKKGNQTKAKEVLLQLKSVFKNKFFMELMRHGLKEQKDLEPSFLEYAIEEEIPIVATNDVYYGTSDLYEAHDALLCIGESRYVSEVDRKKVTPNHYLKTPKEMRELFQDLPEAIENTIRIAKMCKFLPVEKAPQLPHFPTNLSEPKELERQARLGLAQRMKERSESDIKKYEERLIYELGVINAMGFPGYFLIVSDFIKWAKDQDIPVGPGRGSGAGSVVAWSLLITDIDPIKFGLIFERFLNPDRVSMPDFDIDFCQERRDEVIKYVQERYGKDKVAHIITFGKLQARAVLRDVGRVLQMPYGHVDKICKLIPNNPADPFTIERALEAEPLLKKEMQEDDTAKTLIQIGMQLEGLYRHASTHAAGVVIGDRPLYEIVPMYKEEDSDLAATQFDMKNVEAAGLVKFDFLGLKTLSVIAKAEKLIRAKNKEEDNVKDNSKDNAKDKEKDSKEFSIKNIPLDDKKTFEFFAKSLRFGLFQLESAGMGDVLKKLHPDSIEDIIALVALYRPGPMDDIPRYLACKSGEEEVFYLHPSLKPILENTYGVMVYQEQVMRIAQELGGYSMGEADLLRRAMGKKIKEEMDQQMGRFVDGAMKKGVNSDIASRIFDQIAKFAGYGFNKSHAAPYGLIAYQTAYLKANHPLEFFAATMSFDMNNQDKIFAYLQDMKKMKIDILSPDINKSDTSFTVEGDSIRFALCAIKNVGEGAMSMLVSERDHGGEYKDFDDFVTRSDTKVLNKRQLEFLVAAGAFDNINPVKSYGRRELYSSIPKRINRDNRVLQPTLFHDANTKHLEEWGKLNKLSKEFDALGFYLSDHPLNMYKETLKSINFTNSDDIQSCNRDNVTIVGVIINKKEKLSKKTGSKFAFIRIIDLYGPMEVVFFSEGYLNAKDKFIPGKVALVEASVKKEGENVRLIGRTLEFLDDRLERWNVSIKNTSSYKTILNKIKDLNSGKTLIQIHIKDSNAKITLPKKFEVTADAIDEMNRFL